MSFTKWKEMEPDTQATVMVVPMVAVAVLAMVFMANGCSAREQCMNVCQTVVHDQAKIDCMQSCK